MEARLKGSRLSRDPQACADYLSDRGDLRRCARLISTGPDRDQTSAATPSMKQCLMFRLNGHSIFIKHKIQIQNEEGGARKGFAPHDLATDST